MHTLTFLLIPQGFMGWDDKKLLLIPNRGPCKKILFRAGAFWKRQFIFNFRSCLRNQLSFLSKLVYCGVKGGMMDELARRLFFFH